MTTFLIVGAVASILGVLVLNLIAAKGRFKAIDFERVLILLGLVWLVISIFVPELSMKLGSVNSYFGFRWLGILFILYGMVRWIYRRTILAAR